MHGRLLPLCPNCNSCGPCPHRRHRDLLPRLARQLVGPIEVSKTCTVIFLIQQEALDDAHSSNLTHYYRTIFPASACGSVRPDRKSTRLNSSHVKISYAVFCLKKKK